MSDLTLRKLSGNQDFNDVIELHKKVWILDDYKDCIPDHILYVIAETGGLLLGAFFGDKLVGFLCIMAAYSKEYGHYHHSHISAVDPDHRNKNIAFKMKVEHLRRAKEIGIRRIEWTYDPLLGQNAYLNIRKLGGIARRYKRNLYGNLEGGSGLVYGIPSDRFLCEWIIGSQRVEERIHKDVATMQLSELPDIPCINQISEANEFTLLIDKDQNVREDRYFFEIPKDFQGILDADKELAQDLRLRTREVFEKFINEDGYTATDFIRAREGDTWRNFYLFEKNADAE